MMNTKTIKIISWILLLAGAGYGAHLYFKGKAITDKATAIKQLIKANPQRDGAALEGMGEEYVIMWANAVKQGAYSFLMAGKKYDAATGRAIQN